MDANTRDMTTPIVRGTAGRRPARAVRLRHPAGLPAAAAAAALALSALLPGRLPAQPACTAAGKDLYSISPIESVGGALKAVVAIESGERWIPGNPKPQQLRYYAGHVGHELSQPNTWPPRDRPCALPGPTLKAKIGDQVQITFLNRVNTPDFAYTPDSGVPKTGQGCDQNNTPVNGVRTNVYPEYDKYPNCFHASASANIHFHGTHVTPATTGDNVLITVLPERLSPEDQRIVQSSFDEVFKRCGLRQEPKLWEDLPGPWTQQQQRLLEGYDRNVQFQGGRGLPEELRLWPKDQRAIDNKRWPQFYDGSYPYCFELPRCPVDQPCGQGLYMGQAPGTHWYHSHKHGSTTLNLFNGLSGAFIIEDDSPEGYDGKLRAFYARGGHELKDQVLVVQQLAPAVNLFGVNLNTPKDVKVGPPNQVVNGQPTPTITMQPGEVQRWRIVNASVQTSFPITFTRTSGTGDITFRQTAQDGVQLAPSIYGKGETPGKTVAPANRVDLLVQAPMQAGTFSFGRPKGPLLNVNVSGTAYPQPMGFPTQAEFPEMPKFLTNLPASPYEMQRPIGYGSRSEVQPPPATNKPSTVIQFTINNTQFEDHRIDELMKLDDVEVWTISNADTYRTISHPFHIHVNPFQIIELYQPSATGKPQVFTGDFVWWDTFAIPTPYKMNSGDQCYSQVITVDGANWCPGYFKMRTRFADFTGEFVEHCHILSHEDRGMMQLLKVDTKTTPMEHH
jgi:FtsP/CotA-like multicopper oxidase with cupredoxin domain